MQKSKSQFINIERILSSNETQELLLNINQIKWVNVSESAIRLVNDRSIDITKKSLKDLQECLSQISVNDDVHDEPSMIQLI